MTELGRDHRPRRPAPAPEPRTGPRSCAAAARRTTTVDGVLRQAFLRGLSTRETAALAETLTGVPLSRAAVSRLARALDAQVAAFHRRPITFPARYLLVDGLWVGGPAPRRAGPAARRPRRLRDRCGTGAGSCSTTARRPAESAAEWGRLLTLARRARPRPRRGRARRRRRGRRDRRGRRRGLPRRGAPALLDAPAAEPPRGPARSPSGGPACAGCARSTGPGPGGPRWPPTGAGRGPGAPAIPSSCDASSATSTTCSRSSRCPSRCGSACARRTCSSAPSASSAAGSGRSAASPTAAQPIGSSTARSLRLNELLAATPARRIHTRGLTSSAPAPVSTGSPRTTVARWATPTGRTVAPQR